MTTHQFWHGNPIQTPLKIAVFISGGGRTLVNLLNEIEAGQLNAQVVKIIASNTKSVDKLTAQGVALPAEVFSRKRFDSTSAYSQAIFDECRAAEVQLICLAGFLSLIEIPEDYTLRVVNIHPSLLPAFGGQGMYGRHVHQAVIERGCKVTGCTVHFADNEYDNGPILVQRTCPVLPNDTPDTLAARVFEQECLAYPEALKLLVEQRVEVAGRVVKIKS